MPTLILGRDLHHADVVDTSALPGLPEGMTRLTVFDRDIEADGVVRIYPRQSELDAGAPRHYDLDADATYSVTARKGQPETVRFALVLDVAVDADAYAAEYGIDLGEVASDSTGHVPEALTEAVADVAARLGTFTVTGRTVTGATTAAHWTAADTALDAVFMGEHPLPQATALALRHAFANALARAEAHGVRE